MLIDEKEKQLVRKVVLVVAAVIGTIIAFYLASIIFCAVMAVVALKLFGGG